MSQLLEVNLPLYFQCIRIPSEWRLGRFVTKPTSRLRELAAMGGNPEPEGEITVRKCKGAITTFDPWQKRSEFFRLREGDTRGLTAFLESVGLFEAADLNSDIPELAIVNLPGGTAHHTVRYVPTTTIEHVWAFKKLMEGALRRKSDPKLYDFKVEITRIGRHSGVIFTTLTFVDAILLTLKLDFVQDTKMRKCARPDCGVTFTYTGRRARKYCDPRCGHIEAVRRQRKRAQIHRERPTTF